MSIPSLSERQTGLAREGDRMTIDLAMAALVATILIGPFIALAVAAPRFGVDSRPGINDADRRPWLVGH
jgi:hypothetical protein